MAATATRVRVDVAPLREAFLRSGLTATEVADRLGWHWSTGRPDSTRLLRALGLKPHTSHGHSWHARVIGVERAALIAEALNLDPWEVGI